MYCAQQIAHTLRRGDSLYQLSRRYQTTVQDIFASNPNLDPYNLMVGTTVYICPGASFLMRKPPAAEGVRPNPASERDTAENMREAWEQHVYWTRMFLISTAERLNDQSDVTARLMRNPKDIADVFEGYFGADIAKTIERLLTEHLKIGGDLITALRDGKSAEAENLTSRWYANADEMATVFGGISPNYNQGELQRMLNNHLDLTTREVAARLAKNYPEDIMAFDQVEREALSMADYFSSGIGS